MAIDKNKKKTLVYILLPEYVDLTHSTSTVSVKANTTIPLDVSVYKRILTRVKSILSFFGYEYIYPIYNIKNLKSFAWPIKTVEDIYPDGKLFLQNLNRSIGWTTADDVSNSTHVSCILYGTDVTKEVIGDMASRQKFGNAVVILNMDALTSKTSPLPVTEKYTGQSIEIVSVDDIPNLHKWISKNRVPQRQYTFNPKHGDKFNKATYGSQLLTDENETKRLLASAVGETRDGALWLYDKTNNAYIYFENQHELRLAFHGYHVKEGDENYENINLQKLKIVKNM